jgi:hypothetical protein
MSVQMVIFVVGVGADAETPDDAGVDDERGMIETVAPGIGILPDFTMP